MKNNNEIRLDGINLTIKGHKFTLTMEELVQLNNELAKVIPPLVTYPTPSWPIIIREVQPYNPEPWKPWVTYTDTTLPKIN